MADYLQQVKAKEEQESDLRSRMDTDRDLVRLSAYTMKDIKGRPVPDVVNVTLNKPAVFDANVESALNKAIEQVNIISEDPKCKTDLIADCVRAGFAAANARARQQGRWPLNPYIDQQMCRRGGAADRVLFRPMDTKDMSGKTIRSMVSDITPWDRRFTVYDVGEDGLSFASYRTQRTRASILAEYPDVNISGKIGEVVDYWNPEVNAVYVNNSQVLEQANPYGFVPVCVQTVTLGSMLSDDDDLKYQGESIFYMIREAVPELNRLISIMQTLNMIGIKPPKEWQSKEGQQEPPDYTDAMAAGSITASETGGGIKDINFGDLKNAAMYALQVIEKAITEGSLDIINVGDIPSGGLSAVALIQIGEGRDQIFLPRLAARGLLNQQIADMMLRQIIMSGESSVQLGTKGRARTFQVSQLQGEYEVEFKYFVTSPKVDVARYEIAQSAMALGMSKQDVWKDIIQHPEYEDILKNSSRQEAEQLSPYIKALRIIRDLADSDDDDDQLAADILAAQYNIDVNNMQGLTASVQGQQQQQVEEPNLTPLLQGMERPNSAKQATQLQQTPQGGMTSE
jgi:hypothetical protein